MCVRCGGGGGGGGGESGVENKKCYKVKFPFSLVFKLLFLLFACIYLQQ